MERLAGPEHAEPEDLGIEFSLHPEGSGEPSQVLC